MNIKVLTTFLLAALLWDTLGADFPEAPGVPGTPYHRYRKVENRYYDLQPIYDWLKVVHKPGNQVTEQERNSVRPMREWRCNYTRVEDGCEFYKVSQVIAEGIIIEPETLFGHSISYGNEFLLVNYPWKDRVSDGKQIRFLALKTGIFNYEGRTMEKYDYGVPYDPRLLSAEIAAERKRTNSTSTNSLAQKPK